MNNPNDDSGSDNQEENEADLNDPMAPRHIEEDETDDEEVNNNIEDHQQPQQRQRREFDPVLDRHQYTPTAIPTEDEYNARNERPETPYIFIPNGIKTIDHYRDWSPIQIVLNLATPFFTELISCTNEWFPLNPLSWTDVFFYHACLTLMTMVELETTDAYWKQDETMMQWGPQVRKFLNTFTRYKFKGVRERLRGYTRGDADDLINPPGSRDKGWKVQRIIQQVQNSFRNTIDVIGEFISLDEGMARGSSCRNPIYVSLNTCHTKKSGITSAFFGSFVALKIRPPHSFTHTGIKC